MSLVISRVVPIQRGPTSISWIFLSFRPSFGSKSHLVLDCMREATVRSASPHVEFNSVVLWCPRRDPLRVDSLDESFRWKSRTRASRVGTLESFISISSQSISRSSILSLSIEFTLEL
uniref:Uncharacterized protein n=1 Tax=Cacopsylla melanoneura TaxID=428564 RepID=A0A8D8ZR07_9HEMI